jgi:predicted RNase H-like nuclease (RuvC/YqgF family)
VLSQTLAANQWAYYQAKSIKSYLYEIQKEALELELKKDQIKGAKSFKEEYEKKIDLYAQKIKKYEGEKAETSKEAKRLETLRDDAQRHSGIFGIAVIFLQIAILLSSIAALMKKKVVWVIGMGAGVVGLVYFVNGFLLFF